MPVSFHDGGLSCDSSQHEGTGPVWKVTPIWVRDVAPSGGDAKGKVTILEGENDGFEAPLGGGVP